jgi:pimeloyl-ACP methyl ester carboxylesterase
VPEFLLRYPLRTEAVLPRVLGPVMLVHGSEDQLIPLTHSVVLLRLAPKARLAMIPGAAHNDLQDFSTYRDILRESLDRL